MSNRRQEGKDFFGGSHLKHAVGVGKEPRDVAS